MSTPLRVLIVEDSEDDAILIVHELRRGGYAPTFERVDRPQAMRAALADQTWDVIIADYSLPRFSGLAALELLQASQIDLPFILVSGTIGEDIAVAAMKAGAHDYLMKDNLARLVPAVARELHEAQERRARRQAEEEAMRRAENMAAVSELAIQCAAASPDRDLFELMAEELRLITGALAVGMSTYDPETKDLTVRYVAIPGEVLSGISKLLGKNPIGIKFPVSSELYTKMISEVVTVSTDLSEISLGATPKPAAAAIQKTFGIDTFTALALQQTGELLGTAIIVMPKGQKALPLDLAKTMAYVLAVSLRRKRAEDALRASEERFRNIFEHSPIGMYQTTPDGQILTANPTMVRMLGYASFEELAERNLENEEYFASYARSEFKQRVEREGQIVGLEATWAKKDGSLLFIRENARAVYDEHGKVLYYEGTAEDISHRVRAEQLLQALNQAALAIERALTHDEIFNALAGELKKLGFWCMILPADESQSRLFTRYVSQESAAVQAAERLVGLKQKDYSFPIKNVDIYKEVVWGKKVFYVDDAIQVLQQVIPSPARSLTAQIAKLMGMTEIKAIAAPMIVGDEAIGVLSVQSDDLTRDDIPAIMAFAHQLAAAWHKARLYQQAQQEIADRMRAEEELRQRGRELAILNRVIAASASAQEEEALLETTCRELVHFFDVSYAAAALLNPETREVAVVAEYGAEGQSPIPNRTVPIEDDPAFQYLLKRRMPLIVSDAPCDSCLESTGWLAMDDRLRDLLLQRGISSLLCLPLIAQDEVVGSLSLHAIEVCPFSAKEVNLAWSVADQVAGALTRVRLDEERRRLSTAIEQAAESVMITDNQGTILYVNPTFEQLSGYSRAEVIGRNPQLLKSGKQDTAFYQSLWATISAGKVWHAHMVNKNKDGTLRTLDTTITPVRGESDQIVNYVGLQRDISRELQLEEQYLQAQKMEAVGLLAGGIAHDFNNLLTAINGFAELMVFELPADDPNQETAAKILGAGQRAADLVRQLLAFSRKQVIQPRVLDLNHVVVNLEKMLRRIIGEDIHLETTLTPGLWSIKADPTQIEQVIVNLSVNARDAMPDGGELKIETANVVLDAAYVADHLGAQPGEHVQLSVSDTGIGMSEEVRARIFEPFFTTKERGRGTGLGLATVYGIVEQNGGHIWVESEEGRGTVFRLYLPRSMEVADSQGTLDQERVPLGGKETVLLVEDEAAVRELVAFALRGQGYTVLEAASGQDALRLVQKRSGEINLLLTDVILPGGMNGKDLADRLLEERPGLKALFMSGYADSTIARHGVLETGVPFIEKPFLLQELARKVRNVLDA